MKMQTKRLNVRGVSDFERCVDCFALTKRLLQPIPAEKNLATSQKTVTTARQWYFVTIIVLTYCEKKLFW